MESKEKVTPEANGTGTEQEMKWKRKLTPAEQKRVEAFDITEAKLKQDGYKRKDLTVSLVTANFVGPLLILPFIVIFVAVFSSLYGMEPFYAELGKPVILVLAVLAFIPLAPVHELIHGLFWSINAEHHWKDIEFGFMAAQLTPYCYCRSPLSKGSYILGSLMPMTILGALICILAIIIVSPSVLFIGLLQLLGGAGDILISFMLIRYKTKGKDVVLMDHPTDCGLIVFEK